MTAPQDHGDSVPAAAPDEAATLAPPPEEPEELPVAVDPADTDDPAAEIVDGVPEGEPTGAADAAPDAAPYADADIAEADIVDAELVPTPNTSFAPPVVTPRFDYTDAGVPTLDYLRDKIEGRYGTALGGTELAQESQEGRDQADREAARTQAAADKLAEIRRSLHPEG